MCNQSQAVLHANIVPVFSLSNGDESWLPDRQISAQVALEHACAASDLFDAVLNHLLMLSAIPSFVAYAANCSHAAQIPFMRRSEASVRERAHRNVRINSENHLDSFAILEGRFFVCTHSKSCIEEGKLTEPQW